MFTRLVSVGFNGFVQAPELWFESLFEVILPIVGSHLERKEGFVRFTRRRKT
jgi:hypothetical protein